MLRKKGCRFSLCWGRRPATGGRDQTARKDAKLGGKTIRKGDKVVMYFGSANRDPAQFDRADQLDLARAQNEHIAFGNGPHVCLGQHIARIEIDAMLVEVLSRMEEVERTAPPEWLASNFISGPRTMPVKFRAGRRLGVG
ncbi:cytochrome P450 [Phenylobacterium sp.]|uniref:cytochrome P450 n=1 Tax=Phenylobacterium sp. TaxID=1871053 RepID=UPI0025E545DF|nr:cytochrome P450 [Phenylobacterium sp.]